MISLTLLHPNKSVPVQNWTFDAASTIRIGRSADNDVVLYSAVVSRHHLEIRRSGADWEIVNLGTNGTYIEGKPIQSTIADDGTIVCLASSGPKIQIHIQPEESPIKRQLAKLQESFATSAGEDTNDTSNKETVPHPS